MRPVSSLDQTGTSENNIVYNNFWKLDNYQERYSQNSKMSQTLYFHKTSDFMISGVLVHDEFYILKKDKYIRLQLPDNH